MTTRRPLTHLLFIDAETTGHAVNADPPTDAIVEAAVAKVNLATREVEDAFEALIMPWGPQAIVQATGHASWDLSQFHLDAGNFANVDWAKDATPYGAVLDTILLRFLTNGTTVAGQNPRFDLKHLRRDVFEFKREWPTLDYHVIDLCSSAMYLVMAGEVPGVSMRHTAPWARATPDHKQAHRAMADVKDAIHTFFAMYDYFIGGKRPMPLTPASE